MTSETQLSDWSARSSGGRITVKGRCEARIDRVFTAVQQIYANGGKPFFIAKNGDRVFLVTA